MPLVTRWFLRTSLIFLILAFLLGMLLAARAPLGLNNGIAALNPVFFHLVFVGFVTQLIFGVVLWLFPKHTKEKPRGSETLAWSSYVLLNTGLILRVVAEPINTNAPAPIWGWLLVASATTQWVAGILFAANTWPRVKER